MTAPMLAAPIWRCDVTGNPVGSDTRMIGSPCRCQGCRAAERIEVLLSLSRPIETLSAYRKMMTGVVLAYLKGCGDIPDASKIAEEVVSDAIRSTEHLRQKSEDENYPSPIEFS